MPDGSFKPDADAVLIELCAQFTKLERTFRATRYDYSNGTSEAKAKEAEHAAIVDAQKPLLKKILKFRATTLAGHRARALYTWDVGELKRYGAKGGCWGDRLTRLWSAT